jgi:hypothetical protein
MSLDGAWQTRTLHCLGGRGGLGSKWHDDKMVMKCVIRIL